jgi:hypothetical protein
VRTIAGYSAQGALDLWQLAGSGLIPQHQAARRKSLSPTLDVARASGNDRLVQVLEGLLDHVEPMVLLALSINPDAGVTVAPGHMEIVQATLPRSNA